MPGQLINCEYQTPLLLVAERDGVRNIPCYGDDTDDNNYVQHSQT